MAGDGALPVTWSKKWCCAGTGTKKECLGKSKENRRNRGNTESWEEFRLEASSVEQHLGHWKG